MCAGYSSSSYQLGGRTGVGGKSHYTTLLKAGRVGRSEHLRIEQVAESKAGGVISGLVLCERGRRRMAVVWVECERGGGLYAEIIVGCGLAQLTGSRAV